MANQAQYAATPKVAIATINTANTARDGTGTVTTLFTAGASGSRIDRVVIQATGTTTLGVVRLFIHNGTTAYLWSEQLIAAKAPTTTENAVQYTQSVNNRPDIFPLVIPSGYSLRVSTNNAESFNVIAQGGDL